MGTLLGMRPTRFEITNNSCSDGLQKRLGMLISVIEYAEHSARVAMIAEAPQACKFS